MLKLSPDEAALLKAVCADRDNDLSRLVYADWLDDHGRPERAEFIRLQGAEGKDRHYPAGDGRLWPAQESAPPRIATLWRDHGRAWIRELPKWADARSTGFVRGFAEAFAPPAASFTWYGRQLLDRTPVRQLFLSKPKKVWVNVVGCGWLREVPTILFFQSELTDAHVSALCRADWLIGTRFLSLSHNQLSDQTARHLACCRQLAGLTTLFLSYNQLSSAGVEALLDSPYLTRCLITVHGNSRLTATDSLQRKFAERERLRVTM